jgi:hypothetical protein
VVAYRLERGSSLSINSSLRNGQLTGRRGRASKLMPRSRLAWSCWNYLTRTRVDEQGIERANDPQVSLYVKLPPELPPKKLTLRTSPAGHVRKMT